MLFSLSGYFHQILMPSVREALDSVERHLERHPDDAHAWNSKGVLLAQLEEFGDALRSFEKAITLNPGLTEAHLNKGRILLSIGPDNAEKALSSFQSVLEMSPENAMALQDAAQAFRSLGEREQELSLLERLLRVAENTTPVLLRMGNIHLESGRFDESLVYYNKVLEDDEKLVPALLHRAIAYSMIGDWKNARNSADKARKIAPGNIEAWRVLADVNLRAGRNRTALKALEKASEIDPSDANVENTMGMVEYKERRLKDAEKHFKRAIIRDREHIRALRNLALVSMELEKWRQAVKAWKRYLSIENDDPDAYDALATANARLEDFCAAAKAWQRARKIFKRKNHDSEASRVTQLGRAARINCSRQKEAEREARKDEKATRSFSDRFRLREKK
ncbi:tetratricopeptide repeat protein [Candidatus Thorarchaeota archaeon]|nr:MAG: tetratricopeptide repeat protein [Candidatus Thorarchaeota archaeon]